MNTFIAYDKDTYKILGFISNNYTKIEETKEVFQNFDNYNVISTNMEVPDFFEKYKLQIENGVLIGFKEMEVE